MPPFAAIKRRELIAYLRQLGFDGPFSGGKHEYMVRDEFRLTIPNPHKGQEISVPFLKKLLKEASISFEDWEALD